MRKKQRHRTTGASAKTTNKLASYRPGYSSAINRSTAMSMRSDVSYVPAASSALTCSIRSRRTSGSLRIAAANSATDGSSLRVGILIGFFTDRLETPFCPVWTTLPEATDPARPTLVIATSPTTPHRHTCGSLEWIGLCGPPHPCWSKPAVLLPTAPKGAFASEPTARTNAAGSSRPCSRFIDTINETSSVIAINAITCNACTTPHLRLTGPFGLQIPLRPGRPWFCHGCPRSPSSHPAAA